VAAGPVQPLGAAYRGSSPGLRQGAHGDRRAVRTTQSIHAVALANLAEVKWPPWTACRPAARIPPRLHHLPKKARGRYGRSALRHPRFQSRGRTHFESVISTPRRVVPGDGPRWHRAPHPPRRPRGDGGGLDTALTATRVSRCRYRRAMFHARTRSSSPQCPRAWHRHRPTIVHGVRPAMSYNGRDCSSFADSPRTDRHECADEQSSRLYLESMQRWVTWRSAGRRSSHVAGNRLVGIAFGPVGAWCTNDVTSEVR